MAAFYKTAETLNPGDRTLPGRFYTSAEVYALELERIFYRRWLCMGRSDQIPNPGDFALRTVGQESILLVRDQKGQANAFYNLCRHRGTRLCELDNGKFPATIQCPYHAWTYNLRGELIGAPMMDEVAGFHKQDYPLHEIQVAEWEGFLFASLASEPEPFEQAFAPFLGKFSAWSLTELRTYRRIEYHVQANWKLIVQNYSECYHCPLIHPDLARKSPYRSGQNDLFEGSFLGGFMELDDEVGSLTMSGRACAAPIGAVAGADLGRVYYYAVFPSMLLSLHPDYVMFHTLWPLSSGETRIFCEWLFAPGTGDADTFDPDDAVRFWDMTNRQDWHVCELSQLGVSSRAYAPGVYSPAESLLAAFDRELLRSLE